MNRPFRDVESEPLCCVAMRLDLRYKGRYSESVSGLYDSLVFASEWGALLWELCLHTKKSHSCSRLELLAVGNLSNKPRRCINGRGVEMGEVSRRSTSEAWESRQRRLAGSRLEAGADFEALFDEIPKGRTWFSIDHHALMLWGLPR